MRYRPADMQDPLRRNFRNEKKQPMLCWQLLLSDLQWVWEAHNHSCASAQCHSPGHGHPAATCNTGADKPRRRGSLCCSVHTCMTHSCVDTLEQECVLNGSSLLLLIWLLCLCRRRGIRKRRTATGTRTTESIGRARGEALPFLLLCVHMRMSCNEAFNRNTDDHCQAVHPYE